jgi:hypothetical protein
MGLLQLYVKSFACAPQKAAQEFEVVCDGVTKDSLRRHEAAPYPALTSSNWACTRTHCDQISL